MNQRAAGAPDELDYFPTPPWATRALCDFLLGSYRIRKMVAWEPACGELHMARPLGEYFHRVIASDVYRYSDEHLLADFLSESQHPNLHAGVDFVITNPPFLLAEQFIEGGLRVARHGVAVLVRSAFAEGAERYRELYSRSPPTYELVFSQRVVMLKGRLIRDGSPDPFNLDDAGKPRKASSATSYCWMIWLKPNLGDCHKRWIPPCRLELERPGDYPDYSHLFPAPPAEGLFA